MVHFLKELAADFHSFYETNPVLVENDTVANSRLIITKATQIVLKNGLELLSVKPLSKNVMANISFKNKKFPIKAVPTVGIALLVAFVIVFLSEFFLRDNVRKLNLSDFELNEIDYEFQKILESENYEIQELGLEAISQKCNYYAQSGSFRTEKAAQSQVDQLLKVGYQGSIENVNSSNGYNFIVIVGPFENRSQTNNAREVFRKQNMDSIEITQCESDKNES